MQRLTDIRQLESKTTDDGSGYSCPESTAGETGNAKTEWCRTGKAAKTGGRAGAFGISYRLPAGTGIAESDSTGAVKYRAKAFKERKGAAAAAKVRTSCRLFSAFVTGRCRFDSGSDFKGVFGWISKNSTDFECDLYCFHSGRTYFGIWQTKESSGSGNRSSRGRCRSSIR